MSQSEPSTAAALLDALPLAVVVVDTDVCITEWNRASEVLYGHLAQTVVGSPIAEVLFEVGDRADASALLASVAGGTPWEGDRRVQRRDGMLLVSSFKAVPLDGGAAWIATDGMDLGLAEQERSVLLSAEHAARATAEEALGLVEAIITSAPVGIAVFDLDLRYVRVNEAFAALSGVAVEDHVGGRVGEIVPLPAEVGADLRRVVTTGRTILGRAVDIPSGRIGAGDRSFTTSYFPVRSSTGALVGAGATVIEVTDAKRAETERIALLARAEAAQRRLAILATASTVLTTTMEVDELLERVARVLTPGAGDWCIIELFGPGGSVEHAAVSHRDSAKAGRLAAFVKDTPIVRDGQGPVAWVLRTGEGRLFGATDVEAAVRAAADDRGRPEIADQFPLHSSIVVPIAARGETLGVLVLSTEDGGRVLDDDDLDLAVEVAHRAALALGNARAFQQEHQIAETLQRALLPAWVPAVPGVEVAVRYLAATDRASVGGDWYDVIAYDDGALGIIIGDVVGHDIAASTTMGQLRSVLRAYSCEDHASPGTVLSRLDRLFDTLALTYATCILGVLDPETRQLRWSNAGHPPAVLVRNGTATLLVDGAGVLLGVTAGHDAAEASVDLRDDDILILYTDGLIERRIESLSDGLARLEATAATLTGRTADEVCDLLLARLLPAEAARDDDVAILVVRVHADHTHRLDLDASTESVALARGFTAGVLEPAGWGAQVDTAVLLVSEIVTNAVRHGAPPCALTITFRGGLLEISVEDGATTMPKPTRPDPLDENGRGFVLVEALSTDWGMRALPDGKSTWFRLTR